MLEEHLKSPTTCRRLRNGPAAPYVGAFADWMYDKGYRPGAIFSLCRYLAAWTDWMRSVGLETGDLVPGLDAYKGALATEGRLRYANGQINKGLTAASVFIRFLRSAGIVPEEPREPSPLDTWPVLRRFDAWARHHHGLAQLTIEQYEVGVADLLAELGDNPAEYTAVGLRTFILERSRRHGVHRGKTYVSAIRAFLRFLAAEGECRAELADAIPSFASWKLSSVPRYIEPEDVQRVIDACIGDNPKGRRDRAVILLLARLGLRAGEVERLTFSQIDWRSAQISLSGKSRRQERLPLPQEVGDAILDYHQDGRPPLNVPQIFVTVRAPYRPLSSGSLWSITETALRRAGIEAPSYGPHVFRHSLATAMLRQGASLTSIGAVLRHRSPDTTMHYAKVDFGLLAQIAQPWPEVSSC